MTTHAHSVISLFKMGVSKHFTFQNSPFCRWKIPHCNATIQFTRNFLLTTYIFFRKLIDLLESNGHQVSKGDCRRLNQLSSGERNSKHLSAFRSLYQVLNNNILTSLNQNSSIVTNLKTCLWKQCLLIENQYSCHHEEQERYLGANYAFEVRRKNNPLGTDWRHLLNLIVPDNMEMKTHQSPSVRFMVIISINWRRHMNCGMFVPLNNLQYVRGKGLGGGLYWNKGPCNGEPSVGPNLARLAVKGFTECKDLFELLFFPIDTHRVSRNFYLLKTGISRNVMPASCLHPTCILCRMPSVGCGWPLCFPKCPPFMEERLHTVRLQLH